MTTNRIDHTNCSHPRTPKGRAACRAGKPTFNVATGVLDMGTAPATKPKMLTAAEFGLDMRKPTGCTINTEHCENCGSTDYEDLHLGDQGYTACCNELVAHISRDCRNHHSR